MTNIQLYERVCVLKNRLENHLDSPKKVIVQAIGLIEQVNNVLDVQEKRK